MFADRQGEPARPCFVTGRGGRAGAHGRPIVLENLVQVNRKAREIRTLLEVPKVAVAGPIENRHVHGQEMDNATRAYVCGNWNSLNTRSNVVR